MACVRTAILPYKLSTFLNEIRVLGYDSIRMVEHTVAVCHMVRKKSKLAWSVPPEGS